jgi:error-prone DNA polymerase
MSYVELHARSAFSFLRGASSPEQLAVAAAQLGLPAVALCDRDGVYGAPRFSAAAREVGVRPIIGAELTMEGGVVLPVLVESRRGYQNLCRLITQSKLRAEKGQSAIRWEELPEFAEGWVALTGDEEGLLGAAAGGGSPKSKFQSPKEIRSPESKTCSRRSHRDSEFSLPSDAGCQIPDAFRAGSAGALLEHLLRVFGPRNVFVEIQRHRIRGEERRVRALVELAAYSHLPLLATNGVLYAQPRRRPVLDVFTCIRHHTHLDAAGRLLSPNSERGLKGETEMRELFHDLPEAIDNTARLAERLQFTLADLGYEFPAFPVPPGETMDSVLRQQTFAGARQRYGGVPEKVQRQLEHELVTIARLGFAGYFLIVADLVRFCREERIMAQGRGSAANSSVCFCLGITAVDPLKFHTLFERFLSEGRKGWPDIDIDLPSGDRRERVIQEVYRRYGRHGAAMTANVITYRGRSAAREIGKALNLPPDVLDRYSNLFANGDFPHTIDLEKQLAMAGLPRTHPRTPAFMSLYQNIYGLPRHLGQHSGGMVIGQGRLDTVVPLEPAAMPGRTVIQWDKEDCEDLGIIKVDLLGLGMMAVLQDALELTRQHGQPVDLARIPEDDPKTYAIMQRADTIGVFQIESRAQMATLPRMKPKNFYDVVVEVAIIRPGPIQGHLMHPYLARRQGREPVTYYDERVRPVLERTLGVPLFQEQMLEIAMVMADFTGSEAEELRRAMSFHRSPERMARVEGKLREAMARKGVKAEVVEQIVKAVSSFALYGFPESHAISFALLAYGSAYLKAHRPLEFYTGLLNNQPMGFYSPATLVKDAQRHGVRIKPVCVLRSAWDCTIEEAAVDPEQGNGPASQSRSNANSQFSITGELDHLPAAGPGREATESSIQNERWDTQEGESNRRAPSVLRDAPALPAPASAAIRLGLRRVSSLSREHARALLEERHRCAFTSLEDLRARVPLSKDELRTLAEIGALNGFAAHRRAALWEAERRLLEDDLFADVEAHASLQSQRSDSDTLNGKFEIEKLQFSIGISPSQPRNPDRTQASNDASSPLAPMTPTERLRADYLGTGVTLGPHPMALIRAQLKDIWRAADLPRARHGQTVRIAGNVICRQRPGTAKGFVFISLEDETGVSNAIVAPPLFEKRRLVITQEPFLVIGGPLQNVDGMVTVKARCIERLSHEQLMGTASYDFH